MRLSDGLDAGHVSVRGRNYDGAGQRVRVVDGKATPDLRPRRRRNGRNDLGAGARADEELSIGAKGHVVVISVGDDDRAGIDDGHGAEVEDGEEAAGR